MTRKLTVTVSVCVRWHVRALVHLAVALANAATWALEHGGVRMETASGRKL